MLLDQHPDVDAIACGSDQIARGVLDTLRDLGRRVPEDVAVIGYDNWEVLTTNARPELTSIDANLQQLGRESARALFQAMGPNPAEGTDGVRHLPVRLVIRGSTIARR
jgi:LacI family transcriptional regulator